MWLDAKLHTVDVINPLHPVFTHFNGTMKVRVNKIMNTDILLSKYLTSFLTSPFHQTESARELIKLQ